MASPIVRPTTVKEYLKESSGMRVGDDAITQMVEMLGTIADRIVARARELPGSDGRTTLLGRDIRSGFEAFLLSEGPSMLSPETIHGAIDQISNESLNALIRLLQAELEDPA